MESLHSRAQHAALNQHQCPPVWNQRLQHAACIYFASAGRCLRVWCPSSKVLGGCGSDTSAHDQVREDVRAKSPDLSFGETGSPSFCLRAGTSLLPLALVVCAFAGSWRERV